MIRVSRIALTLFTIVICLRIGEAQAGRSGITVEIASQKPLKLHLALRSGAKKRVEIYTAQLPWATRENIVLAIVTDQGRSLERQFPVEDGPLGRISLEPGKVVSGDISLEGIFNGLDEARRKSDVFLFWAFKAPRELNIGRWLGGWILLPQNKHE